MSGGKKKRKVGRMRKAKKSGKKGIKMNFHVEGVKNWKIGEKVKKKKKKKKKRKKRGGKNIGKKGKNQIGGRMIKFQFNIF